MYTSKDAINSLTSFPLIDTSQATGFFDPGALTRSKFSASIEPVQNALSRLEEAVDHIYNQFAPILGPDNKPTSCDNEKDAPQCDYEHFISSTCAKIHVVCKRIDIVCDRSVI